MAKRSLGKMSKRSRLLRRRLSERKLGLNKLIKAFSLGDRVVIDHKAGFYGSMPHPRYRGRHGTIVGKRGTAYVVELDNYSMKKQFTIPPVHLEKA